MGLYEMDVSVDESFSPDSCTRNDGLSCRNRRQPGKASDIICVYSQLNDGLSVSVLTRQCQETSWQFYHELRG